MRCWAGLDGCRSGWVLAVVGDDHGDPPEHDTGPPAGSLAVGGRLWLSSYARFGDAMVAALDAGALTVGVDMPIGLSENGRRVADAEARHLLGRRRSTVFPTPVRAVLDATDYRDALVRSRQVSGKGLSKQAWNLVGKISEVDRWVTGDHDDVVFEVHPELAFARLAGEVLAEPKRTVEGRRRRSGLLAAALGLDAVARERLETARPAAGVAADDVLDATAVALSARVLAAGTGTTLGDGARDRAGRPMRICF